MVQGSVKTIYKFRGPPSLIGQNPAEDDFDNVSHAAFTRAYSKSAKRLIVGLYFCAFGICTVKSCK